ncbi:MAG TPA: hypothetical protein VGF73_07745 [Chthoniobacterales bacterium]
MPLTTELTEDYMGIIHVGSGVVTSTELLDGCRSVTALVQNTENFHYKMVDFSAATELVCSEDNLREIIEQDRLIANYRPHAAVVIVAPNESIQALARHWEVLVEELGWSTCIARTRDEALQWLRDKSVTAQVAL